MNISGDILHGSAKKLDVRSAGSAAVALDGSEVYGTTTTQSGIPVTNNSSGPPSSNPPHGPKARVEAKGGSKVKGTRARGQGADSSVVAEGSEVEETIAESPSVDAKPKESWFHRPGSIAIIAAIATIVAAIIGSPFLVEWWKSRQAQQTGVSNQIDAGTPKAGSPAP